GALRLSADRGLRDDRNRGRRADRGEPRAAPYRHALHRPPAAGIGNFDRGRDFGASGAASRARSAPRLLLRLPQGSRGHGRRLARRLVPHRRRGAPRARRHAAFHRSPQERHPPRRREHRGARGRGGARRPSRSGRGGRDCSARPGARRGSHGLRRPQQEQRGEPRDSDLHPELVPRATRLLQGAGLCRLPRAASRHLDQQGAKSEAGRLRSQSNRLLRRPRAQAPAMTRKGYEGVAVAVPVSVPYVRYSIRAAHWWLARCFSEILKAAGLKKDAIDGLSVSSFTLAPDTAIGLTQHLGVSPRWLDHVPLGGASAVVALRRAARAVQAGDADIVACIAGDTNHVDSFRLTLANFSQFARDAVYPYGAGGPNASFAFLTAYYMRVYGATREDFGKLCVAQRANALEYSPALFKKPLSLEEYLSARPIAEPLHLFDCVMPCAGAEGFLVLGEERAKTLGVAFASLIGTIERHNAFASDPVQMRAGWALDREELYAQAGAGPGDMDFVQTY